MDLLPNKKIEKWTIETAQMKHAVRLNSMNSVADSYLQKQATERGIDKFKDLIKNIVGHPEIYDGLSDDEREYVDLASTVGMWPTVAACVKPYITLDEWILMDYAIVMKLAEAAQEHNPQWFSPTEPQEKKTKRQPKKSLKNSETL